jgi:serine/threonine protein kinase
MGENASETWPNTNGLAVEGGPAPIAANRSTEFRPTIPDHELLHLIGRGSYGEVWLARTALGSLRAVKVVYRKSFDHDRPYEREFEGLKKFEPFSHARESQVDIFHVGRNDAAGFFYYIMELADPGEMKNEEGRMQKEQPARSTTPISSLFIHPSSLAQYTPRTLKHDLRTRGALPVTEGVQIALSLTRALEHLHAHGLVHRDIKPSNIIFVKGVPKLADIGLVTSVDATRSFVGTDGYIPSEGPGTPQADIYSLGKVLYELVTGKDRLEFPELPADWRTRADFDRLLEFNEILTKACDAEPGGRYQSAKEMAADLALLHSGQSVKQKRTSEQRLKLVKRIFAATALLAIATATVTTIWRELKRFGGTAALRTDVPSFEDGRPSTNAEATRLYVRARQILEDNNISEMGQAFTNLNEAIRLDPNFARPYVALLALTLGEKIPSLAEYTPARIRDIRDKLMKVDASLAAAHCADAMVQYFDWNFPEAEKSSLRAIQANPNFVASHMFYGFMLTQWGRGEEGRVELKKAEALAPADIGIQHLLGHPDYVRRDYTNALKQYMQALRLDATDPAAHHWVGRAYQAMGDFSNAITAFQAGRRISEKDAAELRGAVSVSGERGYWQKKLDLKLNELSGFSSQPNPYYAQAVARIHLGNTNESFRLLQRSYETREGPMEHFLDYLVFDEHWNGVRDDPRFKALLEKVGFTKVARPRK